LLPLGLKLARADDDTKTPSFEPLKSKPDPNRHVWGSERGWFAASYGPFRRLTGGVGRALIINPATA
ncbi:hypothetical protein JZU46_04495, partial [bacterium]|nr:hypothetical protein [bacterium]